MVSTILIFSGKWLKWTGRLLNPRHLGDIDGMYSQFSVVGCIFEGLRTRVV